MIERKPPGVSQEAWVEHQIRDAEGRGSFDNPAGRGRRLDERVLTQSAAEWAAEWARREGADMTAALPPALALRVERDRLVQEILGKATELEVREIVRDFNARLDAAYRRPQEVPPVALAFLDLDRHLARWHEAHPVAHPSEPPPEEGAQTPQMGAPRRRWRLLGRLRSSR